MAAGVFTSEPFYGFHRHIHQPLRAGNLLLEALGVLAAAFFTVNNRTLIPSSVWAISSCSSWLIFFRLSSCADRIRWVRRCKCFCRASDFFKSVL